MALGCRRKDTGFHRRHVLLGGLDQVGAGDDGRVAFAVLQRGAGCVETVQGGRASCVEDEAVGSLVMTK
jgi:hypothetical protein